MPVVQRETEGQAEGALSPLQQCEQYVLLKMYEDEDIETVPTCSFRKYHPMASTHTLGSKLDTIDEYVKSKLGEGPIQMIATKSKRDHQGHHRFLHERV